MHHVYTTRAFVVNSTPYGEAGKFLLLFTRDFGMIGAVAQGIRLAKSKLRYHVQDYSFCSVSIVRGKEVWRLVGAHEIPNDEKKGILHIKILKLLKRLLQGEERNEKLFSIVNALYEINIKKEDYEAVECLIILRILNSLGYISSKEFNSLFDKDIINDEVISHTRENKIRIIKVINSALKESQL